MSSYQKRLNDHELDQIIYQFPEQGKIDFKGKLVLINDITKAEFIKDIIAIANVPVKLKGYIIYGVDKDYKPLGISDTFDDAHLQQLVNSKLTNKANFLYFEQPFHNIQIGICEISEHQYRPILPKENFGALTKGTIYIRRGSSTDIATPEEIQKMVLLNKDFVIDKDIIKSGGYQKQYEDFMKHVDDIIKRIQQRGHYLISFHPDSSSQPIISNDNLGSAIQGAAIKTGYWVYPEVEWSQWSNGLNYIQAKYERAEYTQFWRFHNNGHFLHYLGFYDDWKNYRVQTHQDPVYSQITEEISPEMETLNLRYLARILAFIHAFILTLWNYLQINNSIKMSIELKNTRGRRIEGITTSRFGKSSLCEIQVIPLKKESISFVDFQKDYQDYAWEDLSSILRLFNVPNYKSRKYRTLLQEEFNLLLKEADLFL